MMDDFKTASDALEALITHRNLTNAGVPTQVNGGTLNLWKRIELYRQMASTRIEKEAA